MQALLHTLYRSARSLVRRSCDDDDDGGDESRTQPTPAPSFQNLPEVVHHSIASILDDQALGGERLCVSEVSRALLEPYGGSLTRLDIHNVEDSTTARLVALLRRHVRLATVVVREQEALPAVYHALARGCCRKVTHFAVRGWNHNATAESVGLLTAALEMERAMPVLETLLIKNSIFTNGMVYELARWLAGDAVPQL